MSIAYCLVLLLCILVSVFIVYGIFNKENGKETKILLGVQLGILSLLGLIVSLKISGLF